MVIISLSVGSIFNKQNKSPVGRNWALEFMGNIDSDLDHKYTLQPYIHLLPSTQRIA